MQSSISLTEIAAPSQTIAAVVAKIRRLMILTSFFGLKAIDDVNGNGAVPEFPNPQSSGQVTN